MSIFGFLTGSTCGDACWHARETICRCSCAGANHGILNSPDGDQPARTCRIDGNMYELVGIVATWPECNAASKAIENERFPGLSHYAYGNYCQEKTRPVLDRQISAAQARWPEVVAIPGARRLIWARPAGTQYLVRGANHKSVYADCRQ